MTQLEYFAEFERLCKEELEITKLKNGDYANPEDAFANFRLIESVTQGRISVEDGILCRITDKVKRVGSLLAHPANVKEESLDDNLKDIAVYVKIWRIYRRMKLTEIKPHKLCNKTVRCYLEKNHADFCRNQQGDLLD